MYDAKIGDRVIAVCDANDNQVRVFGAGVYEGKHLPPGFGKLPTYEEFLEDVKKYAPEVWEKFPEERHREAHERFCENLPAPRVKLDSGGVVWGFECYWGPEEQVKKWLRDREVVTVGILRGEDGYMLNQAAMEQDNEEQAAA